MVSKLASVDPSTLLAGADRLVEPLEKTLTTKLKGDAVKQEVGQGA
jgi:cullin-associated NEDD8-dissociated protein 1